MTANPDCTPSNTSPKRKRGTANQLPSLARLEVARFGSPVGTAGCSPGRKPREDRRNPHSSPVGAAGNGAFVFLLPLQGSEGRLCSKTRGLRPGLHPVAAPWLNSATPKLACRAGVEHVATEYQRPGAIQANRKNTASAAAERPLVPVPRQRPLGVLRARGRIAVLTLLLVVWHGQPARLSAAELPSSRSPARSEPVSPVASATLSPDTVQALTAFNRGAALMEQYKYSEAAKAFESVLDRAPDWIAARFNLGLAYLNMQGVKGAVEHLKSARQAFETVLATEPEHVPTHFCLGMLYQHLGDDQNAFQHFEAARRKDDNDLYVAYKCAETLINLDRNDEAVQLLEQIVARDPGFVSAVYRLAMQYLRSRQRDKAMPLFTRFKALNAAELTAGSYSVQKSYASAGPYYMVLGPDSLPIPRPETSTVPPIVFSPQTKPLDTVTHAWPVSGGTIGLAGIAAGDLDGDGDLDVCLTSTGKNGTASLWLNDGSGNFTRGATVADRVVSPCFGDIDNDGDLDLWLGRAGPDILLDNDGNGNFSKAPVSRLGDDDSLTNCARVLDVDSDGDLDLLASRLSRGSVPAAGQQVAVATNIYNNNRDGSYSNLAAKLGLSLEQTPVSAVVYDDFDNDRDLDLMVFPSGSRKPVAWVNDRVWKYRILEEPVTGLDVQRVLSATSGDPNKDGNRDLLVFTETGLRLYANNGRFRFEACESFNRRFGSLRATGGQFADMDNDGDLDIVVADAHRRNGTRGPVLLINDWPRDRFLDAAEQDPGNLLAAVETQGDASCLVADFTGNGGCDVLVAPTDEKPFLIENVTPGGHWIAIDLVGTRRQDKKSRSNNSAIGARVEVKTGMVFQQFVVGGSSGPVAMPPYRIHAGLGQRNRKVDWLRILWPDAVLQAELELPADQKITVEELPRKVSSCPHLFAWDGSQFRFVADFGGMGGLGYLAAPGVYANPDPTEYVPVEHLTLRDGQYVLQVLEPLEEVVYFDEAKLIAIDHPEGTKVYPHEMMAINAAPTPFEVFCVGREISPVKAVDHRGHDVTDRLRHVDRRYAGATELDARFTGFAKDHRVELDFGDRLAKIPPSDRLILCLHGWVEYAYSSTNFAAAQAGLRIEAPSIAVYREGGWVELFPEVGYPAGLNHLMTLDVTGALREGDRKIRISTNMELYWDRICLAIHNGQAKVSMTEVAVSEADLHYLGYPREYSPDGHHPNLYDYSNLDRTAAWKLMEGDYTRYGKVNSLLEEPDDCFVIMGRGDELTLRFSAKSFGPVPKGKRRSFLLKTDSYCKDMDLYTAHPDTVGPLPFHAMSGYPYGPGECYPDNEKTRSYRRRYNTRHVGTR